MSEQPIVNTEFDFTLPKGFLDKRGNVLRHGVMRLATAKDEICVQRDQRVRTEPSYHFLVMLSQVITRLGDLSDITPEMLENLFTLDMAYLREFYNRINQHGEAQIQAQCPNCATKFSLELALSGEA